ncbi:hypothetical protein IC619_011530 [Hazenella sp. IB182353]|uniref:hypothetical protein n=1 Tax=Polycladospora coralii TaxID=2771432 RepID=UPI0017461354|nr:hypothetical protein [Polycladospora coralii]MBS7531126.1 hypothetical protein [Polycladospora coralii]
MKKTLTIMFMCVFTSVSILSSVLAKDMITPLKPSGNFCGSDDKKLDSESSIQGFKPDKEFIYEDPKDVVSPSWFDDWTYYSSKELCWVPFTLARYVNNKNYPIYHKFTETTEKSSTYSTSVDAGFQDAFKASMGYSASTKITRTSEFSVTIPARESATLNVRPSVMSVYGKWGYLTGSKNVTVYYPTYLT